MKISALASLLFLALAQTPTGQVQRLDLDHQPFVDAFKAADGSVRLVVVLSPT
jgi:hypothetical protein